MMLMSDVMMSDFFHPGSSNELLICLIPGSGRKMAHGLNTDFSASQK